MINVKKFEEIKGSIQAGLDNINKRYNHIGDNDALFICMVLDLNYKTAYFETAWDPSEYQAGLDALDNTVSEIVVPVAAGSVVSTANTLASLRPTQHGNSWMRSMIQAHRNEDGAIRDPCAELRSYLSDPLPLEDTEIHDIVAWWGLNMHRFPTLARMARDYLAIQGSATASERAFSSRALTGTKHRNRLSPKLFEALQILKSGYHNRHIAASDEARAHAVNEFELNVLDGDNDNVFLIE
ncbi:unnamed protein product [Mycena citricolor]|uniref:HAT C-terminal dimerisation domain-containing protein n=1 Tax=Mycena citricolor TaxID=2018698 RepID=A0AAD2HJL4_9AGAR|nr:unnamed protein product [Mycena citricolor]